VVDVADASDVADSCGVSRDFDQLIKVCEVRQSPTVVRAGEATNIGSNDGVTSSVELISDMRSNETGRTGDNDFLHAAASNPRAIKLTVIKPSDKLNRTGNCSQSSFGLAGGNTRHNFFEDH